MQIDTATVASSKTRSIRLRALGIALLSALLMACAGSPSRVSTDAVATQRNTHENLNAVLWFQDAAEYQAALIGTYANASRALKVALLSANFSAALEQPTPQPGLRPAVVVDIDETILDNSPYQARLILNGGTFEETSWRAWCNERKALAIPGALNFAQAAARNGVDIIYVSNRDVSVLQATIDNLRALGFPNADEKHVYLRDRPRGWGDKGPRRIEIAKTHQILMMIGDNLGDFSDDYKGTAQQRLALLNEHRDWWGERWFMLPNPMYGSWEQSAFEYDYSLDSAAQYQRKTSKLRPAQ